ncbi:hypothetical protein DU976_17565 [Vibrio navarrensis]|nr:hypothetical protein [Vibrio navarrensis]MBH9740871.1 hypothetical protein [Vibrio navarrensis]
MKQSSKLINIITLLLSLTFSYQVYAMDILNKKVYNLTPKIQGNISENNIPIENLEVTLEVSALNETNEFKAITNKNGDFYFNPISISTIKKPSMFDQKMVSTSLTIKNANHYRYLWRSYLPGYEILEFMSDNLANLRCDINSREKYFIFKSNKKNHDGYEVHTICNLHGGIESGYIEE